MTGINSETDLCNSALIKLGADPITELGVDTSKQGVLCSNRYPYIRDEVLTNHPWNFAKKRASLAPSATTPFNYKYTYGFQVPNDLLKLLGNDLDEDDSWVYEGGYICCYATTLNILYIFQQTDTTRYDALAASAIAWRLAAELAYPLVQSTTLAKTCMDAYLATMKDARSKNAQERGSLQQVVADSWSQARVSGGLDNGFGQGDDPSKL